MNTSQIEDALRKHPDFGGVFPADLLPRTRGDKNCFVANTDSSYKPGQHWVAFRFSNSNTCEFFDSYGFPPKQKEFIRFIGAHRLLYNTKPLQGPYSSCCGEYVIYFLTERCRGRSLHQILEFFGNDKEANDRYIHTFVRKHFNVRAAHHPPGQTALSLQ